MADTIEEQILARFKTLLTDLVTTKKNVFRDRTYNYESDELPAINIEMGAMISVDEVTGASNTRFFDGLLDINVFTTIERTDKYTTTLNIAFKEQYAAIMADQTLSLGFVINTMIRNKDKPEISGEGQQVVATQKTTWQVHYRHRLTDASLFP